MRAAFIRSLGGPDHIEVGELPAPRPGADEVLLTVYASSLDPVDALVRSGAYPTATPFPFVLGRDAVGTVIEAGPRATHLLGQRVSTSSLGYDGRQGAWATLTTAHHDRVYPVPDTVDDAVLAAAMHPASTAHLALHRHGQVELGETVLVAGGAGNVGSALVAEAARTGARVVATARARDQERVRALGATDVIDHSADDAAAQLRELLRGRADLVVDTSGGLDPELIADLVAVRARIIVIAAPARPPRIPLARLYTRDVSLRGFVMSRATVDELAEGARGTLRLLQETTWRPHITQTVGLDAARSLHEALDAHEVRGRIVVLPDQTARSSSARTPR